MEQTQGGLIVAHATILRGDMFAGLVLSAAAVRPVVVSPVTAAIVVRMDTVTNEVIIVFDQLEFWG